MKTVRLITCEEPFQARLIQGALENEGIASVLHNENTSNVLRGLTPTITYSRERLEEALLRVQFDDLVALVPQCYFPDTPVPGLRVIQVGGSTGLFYLMAIARSDTPNSAVQMFLRVCRAQLKEECLAEKLEHLPE